MRAEFSILDELIVLKSLRPLKACNQSMVKSVKCLKTGEVYAAKIYLGDSAHFHRLLENYSEQVTGIQIVPVFRIVRNGTYTKKTGEVLACGYLLMQFCSNGDLFELAQKIRPDSEDILRYLFGQLISAIESYQTAGVCQCSIRPENFVIDTEFNLKLLASSKCTKYGGKILGSTGFSPYDAPETRKNDFIYDNSVDIFSAGVVLFALYALKLPFSNASLLDVNYKALLMNSEKYWKQYERYQKCSEEFKNLIRTLLCPDPANRITLNGIKMHIWMAGPVPSKNDFENYCTVRKTSNMPKR